MRIDCPLCGDRDRREFYYQGDAVMARRPKAGEDWAGWLHLRGNTAGVTQELWQHECCGAWLVVSRDTASHAIHNVALLETADEA